MRIFCLMNKRDVYLTVAQAEKVTVEAATGKYGVEELAKKLKIEKT
jgi:hypothetical protein